jgi:hypothetical protein
MVTVSVCTTTQIVLGSYSSRGMQLGKVVEIGEVVFH